MVLNLRRKFRKLVSAFNTINTHEMYAFSQQQQQRELKSYLFMLSLLHKISPLKAFLCLFYLFRHNSDR